jgi:hypothetical protein
MKSRYNGSSSPANPQAGAESSQRVCLLKSCSKSFQPRLPSQLYCEPAHGARARIERHLAKKKLAEMKKLREELIKDPVAFMGWLAWIQPKLKLSLVQEIMAEHMIDVRCAYRHKGHHLAKKG